MDRCEGNVIIAFGVFLVEEKKKTKYWIHSVPSKRRGRRISHYVWTFER
jgi:hypothetical protein